VSEQYIDSIMHSATIKVMQLLLISEEHRKVVFMWITGQKWTLNFW